MRWQVTVAGGVVLGILVVILQTAAVFAGLAAVFPLGATLIELVVLVAAMAQTRREQGYLVQVASGVGMALIACVFIVPGALVVGAGTADLIAGVVGTVVTGVVIALLAATFLRKRG